MIVSLGISLFDPYGLNLNLSNFASLITYANNSLMNLDLQGSEELEGHTRAGDEEDQVADDAQPSASPFGAIIPSHAVERLPDQVTPNTTMW